MNRRTIQQRLPGFAVATLAGVAIWFLSSLVAWLDPLVTGIVGGMLVRTIIGDRAALSPGLAWTPKLLIPPGIILYGARLYFDFTIVSPIIWLQIMVGLVIVVWTARTVGKWFKIPSSTSLLIAVGTAVCGASAIVIAADTAGAQKRDTATSLLVITLWGIIGLGLLPLMARLLGMDVHDQALLYATTLHQTGLVKAAAAHVSGECLTLAMAIKTARIVTIIPLLFIVGTIHQLPNMLEPLAPKKRYRVRIPWYLWGFIAAGLCFTFIPQLKNFTDEASVANSLIWTMAMVSVGLTVDARHVVTSLGRPLAVGLITWIALIMVFLYAFLNLSAGGA